MLAIFDKTVATIPKPEGLELHTPESISAFKDKSLASYFAWKYPGSSAINQPPACTICTTLNDPSIPSLFAVKDDIFCLLLGRIENIHSLPKTYYMNKAKDQPTILIETYKSQRLNDDDGDNAYRNFFWWLVLGQLRGNFVFVLFDALKKTLCAANVNTESGADTSLSFYWGTDVEGNLVLSSDVEIIKQGCDQSYGSFPKGCYISSSTGLRSFADPTKELEVEQTLDNVGNMCLTVNQDV